MTARAKAEELARGHSRGCGQVLISKTRELLFPCDCGRTAEVASIEAALEEARREGAQDGAQQVRRAAIALVTDALDGLDALTTLRSRIAVITLDHPEDAK